jgi:hypothetical protein
LRLIVYHNLHMWYKAVYISISDTGYYWKFFLCDINEIYDFVKKVVIYNGRAHKNI